MKTNNCLRLRVLTRNRCLHLAYVSSPSVRVLTWRAYPQLVYASSTGVRVLTSGVRVLSPLANNVFASNRRASLSTSPTPSGVRTQKNHVPTVLCSSPLKAWTETMVWTDALCRPFIGISIKSIPEIVLSSK